MPCVISLMEWQEAPVFSQKRFLTLMAGRRAGKTDLIKARIKLRTQIPKFKLTYITPFAYQGAAVWRELQSDSAWMVRVRKAGERPFPYFYLNNSAEIQFRNWQRPHGIKGTGENEIIVDESQDEPDENNFDTKIMPMISDKRGTMLMAGQFNGFDWRYSRFWLRGQQFLRDENGNVTTRPNPTYHPQFESWNFPTSVGYCFQGESGAEELALMRSICPTQEIWDQEWACIPRTSANAVFKAAHVDGMSTLRNPRVKYEEHPERGYGNGYATCIDLGGIVDPVGLIVGHESGDVVYEKEFPLGRDDEQNAKEAMEVAGFFGGLVVTDSTGGGKPGVSDPEDKRVELYRALAKKMKLEFQDVYQGRNKERLVLNLRTTIQRNEIGVAPECKLTLEQLKAYECRYNPKTKQYKYSAPEGKHDEFVSAMMCFEETLARGWITRTRGGRPYRAN